MVRFLDAERRLEGGGQLSFGRAADVVVDEANPYLHRVVGRFVWWDGWWWLENLGETVELTLVGRDGSAVRLPPGAHAPLTHASAAVRFQAGGLRYEVEAELLGSPTVPPKRPGPEGVPTAATTRYGEVVLTDEERALVRELARPFLLDPSAGPERLPANDDVASTLGWSRTKLNRKLDYLCARFTKAGVRGLQGGRAQLATNRRWVLVQHALVARLITLEDL